MAEFLSYPSELSENVTSVGLLLYQDSVSTVALIDAGTQAACTKTLIAGVNLETGDAGQSVSVARRGLVKCLAGASVAVGDKIIAETATARGIPWATTGLATGDFVSVAGVAKSAASDGGYFDLDLDPQIFTYAAAS
jgi:hypothetical protein